MPLQAIGVYMEKTVRTLHTFWGCVYAGCVCSSLNTERPPSRMAQISSDLQPGVMQPFRLQLRDSVQKELRIGYIDIGLFLCYDIENPY